VGQPDVEPGIGNKQIYRIGVQNLSLFEVYGEGGRGPPDPSEDALNNPCSYSKQIVYKPCAPDVDFGYQRGNCGAAK
jgi:hypothetical protein